MKKHQVNSLFALVALAMALLWVRVQAAEPPSQLPRPDGKEADMSKPVQVYILLGQSNMVGMGKIAGDKAGALEHAVKAEKKYPYLVDDAGNWTERKDVRNVRVMGSGTGPMRQFNNEWMAVKGRTIGPELGIGHHLGNAIEAPVMILKSCIGNRSLGWDLLPPGSERYEAEVTDKKVGKVTKVFAGYKDSPDSWVKGTEPQKIGWYAGMQYDGDVANAKTVSPSTAVCAGRMVWASPLCAATATFLQPPGLSAASVAPPTAARPGPAPAGRRSGAARRRPASRGLAAGVR